MYEAELPLLLEKYSHKGIVVDANLVILLFVGLVNPERIEKFKRTRQFIQRDYFLLHSILEKFSRIVTTPAILTEVYNLGGQLNNPERRQFLITFTEKVNNFFEIYVPSSQSVQEPSFLQYGFTDSGIVAVSRNQYLVLSTDLPLVNYLTSIGIDALNFNNLRNFS